MNSESESARLLAERFIDYQPRTTREVRQRLTRGGFDSGVVDSVVADLERAGLIDDARFSADWVESRTRAKGLGRVRLASELRRKGVSAEQTDEALQQVDPDSEIAAALTLARKRIGSNVQPDSAEKRRLSAFLQRRGYNWETIQQVFAELFANPE